MNMTLLDNMLPAAVALWTYMSIAWVMSVVRRDTGIVDAFWGPAFIVAAWTVAGRTDGWSGREAVTLALVTVWAVRLCVHILVRNHGKPEDPRYAAWRRKHGGAWWWRSYFTVFLLQAVLALVIALPVLAAVSAPEPRGFVVLDAIAAAVWLTGFLFEAVGDFQLLRFKRTADSSDAVMDRGLWRYTRHPNYFGETLVWWGFFGFAAAAGAWWAIVGPLVITILLLRFSGVTLLEKGLVDTKPGYREYARRTSAFVPMPPKR